MKKSEKSDMNCGFKPWLAPIWWSFFSLL